MPKPLRDLNHEAREAVPFFRDDLAGTDNLKKLCAELGVKLEWKDKPGGKTKKLTRELRTAFGMYSATADHDKFPHLHLTAQEIERRRRNIKRMGLDRAKPFLNVQEIIEHEGGDKARAFGSNGRAADLRFLVNRLAGVFTEAGADADDLPELIRTSMTIAKRQADDYCTKRDLPPCLTALKPRHFTPSYDKEIRAVLSRR